MLSVECLIILNSFILGASLLVSVIRGLQVQTEAGLRVSIGFQRVCGRDLEIKSKVSVLVGPSSFSWHSKDNLMHSGTPFC